MVKNTLSIIWAPNAEINYNKILKYIIDKWSVDAAIRFDNKTRSLLKLILKNNELCPESKIINLRKCVITSQTSLIYRINNDKLEIIDVVSNYSKRGY